jgi:uncharacterized protein YbaP (TraB family)
MIRFIRLALVLAPGLVLVLALATPAAAKPALWVVRDADTEITLFGTVHALPKGVDWLTPAITQRLGTAGSVVIEAKPPEDPLALATAVAEFGMPPGQKPMAKRLPPEDAKRLATVATETGVPLDGLDRMETWLAALTLSQASLARLGITSDEGVEPVILMRATAAKQPIVGLETMEQQLRYLDTLPEEDQLAMLKSAIADVPEAKSETDRLTALWQAGDIDGLAKAFAEDSEGSPRLQKVLITDRNIRWVNWIEGVMRSPGKVFIAVGAGHFGGEDGLIALLKARGLTVERVE